MEYNPRSASSAPIPPAGRLRPQTLVVTVLFCNCDMDPGGHPPDRGRTSIPNHASSHSPNRVPVVALGGRFGRRLWETPCSSTEQGGSQNRPFTIHLR